MVKDYFDIPTRDVKKPRGKRSALHNSNPPIFSITQLKRNEEESKVEKNNSSRLKVSPSKSGFSIKMKNDGLQLIDSQEEMLARDDLGSNPQGGGKQSLLAGTRSRPKFSSQQSRNSNIPSEDDESED